jgi:hypothetical protein
MCDYWFTALMSSHPVSRFIYRNDLEWDGESKRIIAVGDGRDKFVARGDNLWLEVDY